MNKSKEHYNSMDQLPEEAESTARQALEAFMMAWNTGDDAKLRTTMHFPFVSFGGGSLVFVNKTPEDFSQDFDGMREREGWASSSFDYDTLKIFMSSEDKIHLSLDFHRYKGNGDRYASGNVFYVISKKDDHWGIQLRSGGGKDAPDENREEILSEARAAVVGYMKAFNSSDADGTAVYLNYPHLFLVQGNVAEAKSPDDAKPNFDQMQESQNWAFSTFDWLEPSVITANKVHWEVVFSRWHPDGMRYWTVPALWVTTKVDGHWGIQFRSLMQATFSSR
jgi:hypothetical protein